MQIRNVLQSTIWPQKSTPIIAKSSVFFQTLPDKRDAREYITGNCYAKNIEKSKHFPSA